MKVLEFLLPVTAHISCQNERHRVRWERGEFIALDHDDIEGELALAALGGEPIRCAQLVDSWQQAQEDLRVLVLASRGGGDPLNPPVPEDGNPMPGPGMAPQAGWMRGTPSRTLRGRGMAVTRLTAVARPMMPAPGLANYSGAYASYGSSVPGPEMPSEDPLLELMRLPAGLPDRLVAMVITHWVKLITAGAAPSSATAALSVALSGRVELAVQTWLGSSGAAVDVEMLPPGTSPYLERPGGEAGDAIRVGLPFSWLADVWLTGLTHLLGRFTLAAESAEDAVILDTADTALRRRTLTLSGVRP